jgi:hypothetical protein
LSKNNDSNGVLRSAEVEVFGEFTEQAADLSREFISGCF